MISLKHIKILKVFILFSCVVLILSGIKKIDKVDKVAVFRFHIRSDLEAFDPALSDNTIASYVLNSLHSPLLKYQKRQFSSAGASGCKRLSNVQYECTLRADWHWSDGQKVTPAQIVHGFEALNRFSSQRRESFLNVASIKILSTSAIRFQLKKPDHDFLYRLIDPALSPRREDVDMKSGFITAGPFYLDKRTPGQTLYLRPNIFYSHKTPHKTQQVDIEILVVDSDDTALRLYQSKKMNFLRRLSSDQFAIYKGTPDLFKVPFARFDYIGFGPELNEHEPLRKNLIYSLSEKFDQFVQIFDALGAPGCFGLSMLNSENSNLILNADRCYKKIEVKPYTADEVRVLPKLKIQYSLQGEDNIRRGMELFQNGWKTKLNLEVELQAVEQGVYTQILKNSPPPLFRRGVSLDRPTCLAALEVFESTSPNNFIRFKDFKYDQVIKKMRKINHEQNYAATMNTLCLQGIDMLLTSHKLIPMGAIHYQMLTDHKFDNFYINELNQLDVSQLSASHKPNN